MKKKIFPLSISLVLSISIFLSGCGTKEPKLLSHVDTAMGTVVVQQLYVEEAAGETLKAPDDAILEQISALESERLSWRLETSELNHINQQIKEGEEILLSPQMEAVLTDCLDVSRNSGGAFDITIGEVTRLWNIDSRAGGTEESAEYDLPAEEQITEALANSGWEKLSIKDHRLLVSADMSLDLGAVGKGIALTEILSYLQEQEQVVGAVISVGGSVLTYGEKPDGTSWKVGIVNPLNPGGMIGTLSLQGQWCVSTSGDYERYVEMDGVRYHHIMDPMTGYPADSGVKSVTILTKDGFLSDALSTACFVLGEEVGMQLAESYGAEALFVDGQGRIAMTEGMKPYFHLSNEGK